MFIHAVKMFLKFLPFPPCVTFRQPLVLRTHKPSPSSSHGSHTFGPQVRSTTQMPFYLGHSTKYTVETDHELPHMEQTLKDTMAPAMAGCKTAPATHTTGAVLLASYTDDKDTDNLITGRVLSNSWFDFQLFSVCDPYALLIYGVVVWGLRMKTKENEPTENWPWLPKCDKAPLLIGVCKPQQVENHQRCNKASSRTSPPLHHRPVK